MAYSGDPDQVFSQKLAHLDLQRFNIVNQGSAGQGLSIETPYILLVLNEMLHVKNTQIY